jgi:aldehyde:ferredoxin oxidoreductase
VENWPLTAGEFNARAGVTKEQDRLPEFFKTEPVAPQSVVFDIGDEDLDQVFNW